jgi:hypothetical protein
MGPGIAGDLGDVAAIGLSLGIQRLQPGAAPVLAPIRAAEQARPADCEDRSRTPAPDQRVVQVNGVVVHVLTVAYVLPVLAAVEAADDAADFDRTIKLRSGGIDGQPEDLARGATVTSGKRTVTGSCRQRSPPSSPCAARGGPSASRQD